MGELQRAVTEVLWDRAEPVAGRDVAYTTVMTVLGRLMLDALALTGDRDAET